MFTLNYFTLVIVDSFYICALRKIVQAGIRFCRNVFRLVMKCFAMTRKKKNSRRFGLKLVIEYICVFIYGDQVKLPPLLKLFENIYRL